MQPLSLKVFSVFLIGLQFWQYFLFFLQEDQKKSDALKRDMTRLDEVKTEMNNAVHHAGQGHPKTLWSKFYLKDR